MSRVSVWDEFADDVPDADTLVGLQLADDLRAMVRGFDAAADRSQQTDLGPSQIGMECVRCLARMSLGVTDGNGRAYDDPWCRIIGTATHTWLDAAAVYANRVTGTSRWVPEGRVYPDAELLPSGGRADLLDCDRKTVLDHKVVGAPAQRRYRVHGPSNQYRAQAHIYARGYTRAGYAIERVAIAFWLRGGRLSDLYVWTEPYSEALAAAALARYRVIRDTARQLGADLLPLLPADPDCWECGGRQIGEAPMSTAA